MKNKLAKLLSVGVGLFMALSLLMFSASTAVAQGNTPSCSAGFTISNGVCVSNNRTNTIFSSSNTVGDIITTILNYAFAISGIVAVIYILIGGFKYLTAGGEEEATEKARAYIVNALIGLVIVLVGMVIVRVVSNLITGTGGV